ncbi:MAG: GNAT family N-acetyltransferase [Phycisphaerales bacterium]|nr:GNAT family N-acetyltransferase [Phycisphaerales bacterium]
MVDDLPGIRFQQSIEGIDASQLSTGVDGFFDGWPNPPTAETHLEILRGSWAVCLAIDTESNQVVGFINAVSDGVLSAYIPLLEVLRSYRGRGIGSELVRRLLESLADFYMIDLSCDEDVVPFYRSFGMTPGISLMSRNYPKQSGRLG